MGFLPGRRLQWQRLLRFRALSTSPKQVDYIALKRMKTAEFGNIAEIRYREKFMQGLLELQVNAEAGNSILESKAPPLPGAVLSTTIESGLATFLLHCEARIASSIGQGFYTIGPCGEELLGAVALALRDTDSSALHYRHVATSVARQLMAGRAIEDIILDRARGFTCSLLDPVTGGRHCAIGGHKYEFLVTSTLASQATPAVGRALAIPLSKRLKGKAVFPSDAVSFVTVGDGSVHNSHFLSAVNLAKYSQHRGIKCPVVFGVSDNNICISLPGYDWSKVLLRDCGIQSFVADGCNVDEVYWQSKAAVDFSRSVHRPSLLLFKNLPRRFGHAATDRQFAYRTADAIEQEMNRDPLFEACVLAIKRGVFTKDEMISRFKHIQTVTENAFAAAAKEPKATSRDALVNTVSAPLSKDVTSYHR
jgi:TPP-dependent pyruvate/acetoin dehydrogenase alpha subunit